MKLPFTANLLKTAFALSLSFCLSSVATAQTGSNLLRSGYAFGSGSHGNQVARITTLVSRPGTSQDFNATGPGAWQLQANSSYTYDAKGRQTQRVYSDPATSQMMMREISVYDANGTEIEFRVEELVSGSWQIVDGYKSIISSNPQGLKTQTITQIWQTTTNSWQNDYREDFAYDANNLVSSVTNSTWNGTSWLPQDKMVLSNVGGTATAALIQEYMGGTWQDLFQVSNLTWRVPYEIPATYTMQMNDNGNWVNLEKYNALYDANGGHVAVYEEWEPITNAWQNTYRESEFYDNQQNYTGWKEESWDPASSTWAYEGEERVQITYAGLDITQRVFQDSWNASSTLQDYRKEVYANFQTINISGINEQPELAAKLFPNPTSGLLAIALPATKGNLTATLTDVTGKTCLIITFETGEVTTLNLETLPKGIYVLQLQNEAGTTVKRVVKQ